MSVLVRVTLFCNGPSDSDQACEIVLVEDGTTAAKIREVGSRDGWKREGDFDYCPTCALERAEKRASK